MPRFRLHLEWDDDYADRDRAKEDLQNTWNEIDDLTEGSSTLQAFDVQSVVTAEKRWVGSGEEIQGLEAAASTIGPSGGMGYPPDAPAHPWDEGLHIFPLDHPYRAVEDAILGTEPSEEEKRYWERVLPALPPPTGS